MGLSKYGHVIFGNEVGCCWETGAKNKAKIYEKSGVSLRIEVVNDNNYEGKCNAMHNARRLEIRRKPI